MDDSGSDTSNNCATSTSPCQTIAHALSQAGTNDTVMVGGGTYNESALMLTNGISLVGSDFNTPSTQGPAIVDGGASGTTITAMSGAPSVIQNLTIRGNGGPLTIKGSVGVSGDTFDEDSTSEDIHISSGSPVISGDQFTDATTTDSQVGIADVSTGDAQITGNSFSGFQEAIAVSGGSATIDSNDVSGAHNTLSQGFGMSVRDASATITGNLIHDPVGGAFGISISDSAPGAPVTSAEVSRNRILGNGTDANGAGVAAGNTDGFVGLDNDLIAGYGTGLQMTDSTGTNAGDVTATNITIADSVTRSAYLQETSLTLDSSIVDSAMQFSGTPSCVIAFSRGPTTTPGGNGCADFQTTADPMFVNPGAGNYHLQAGSPMIEAGDPGIPPATDIDGDPRPMDGTGSCLGAPITDIGADEFRCVPPNTKITAGPKKQTTDRTPKFEFRGSAPDDSFQCSLDGGKFKACTSPDTLSKLALGDHEFRVRAKDPKGHKDPTPAKRSFKVVR